MSKKGFIRIGSWRERKEWPHCEKRGAYHGRCDTLVQAQDLRERRGEVLELAYSYLTYNIRCGARHTFSSRTMIRNASMALR